jgi:hypothetical protein
MTLLGYWVSADETTLKRSHTGLEWALNPVTAVLVREEDTEKHAELKEAM